MNRREENLAQDSIFRGIWVDNFAGGGGASTGIQLGCPGVVIAAAINHDPAAILMHKTNHPFTEHYQASVWDIDPVKVCRGRHVQGAWFSPDCKHFSKAKGAALVDKHIRGLAWIVLRWAGTVRPDCIFLENVEEFQTWGPVRKGKPVKKLAGTTFRKFIAQLRDLGYEVEWRELVAADYGAPTTRKRFVLIARCDGRPICWPEPTHAPRDSEAVKSGKLLPWRSAAEIIDWSLPCPSIFDSKAEIKEKYGLSSVRPLASNTMRRIIRGVDKFTIRSGEPFIVPSGYGEREGQAPRVHDVNDPLPTVVGSGKHAICAPSLIQYHTEQTEGVRASGLGCPINTVDASNRYGLTCANLVEYYTGGRPLDVKAPMHTVTSHDREAVVAAHVVKFKRDEVGTSPMEPVPTQTSGGVFAVCQVYMCKIRHEDNENLRHWPKIRALLNEYCGYHLEDDEILLLEIGNSIYYIADIGLRMLSPRELYNAMGFPPDYIIDHDYMGNPYPKNEQVARCGNAVCPPLAAAVTRANFPEYEADAPCIDTMSGLHDLVAV